MSNNEVIRTDVEKLLLSEMVAEDRLFIDIGENEAAVDEIIPANTVGLFDDTSSGESIEDLLDNDDNDLF